MKKVANVFTAPAKHWVGNGFHVASMFSYHDKDKNLDPFLLMDYNEPKFFRVHFLMHHARTGCHPLNITRTNRTTTAM